MGRKIIWTEQASGDIEAIIRYLAARDPAAAQRIGYGIYDRTQILLQHAESRSPLEELSGLGWRKLIFRRWKIVYKIEAEEIIIGRVWPAALGEADLTTPL